MNINQLMKQAQVMQKKMKELQEEIAKKEFEGKSGGGIVSVKMSGNGEMHKISIDPSLLKPDDKEILEDLIIAAYNDAKAKAESSGQDFKAEKPRYAIKAGSRTPYIFVKDVVKTFTDLKIFQFNMITSLEGGGTVINPKN